MRLRYPAATLDIMALDRVLRKQGVRITGAHWRIGDPFVTITVTAVSLPPLYHPSEEIHA